MPAPGRVTLHVWCPIRDTCKNETSGSARGGFSVGDISSLAPLCLRSKPF